jgi:cystathionine beta-lyase
VAASVAAYRDAGDWLRRLVEHLDANRHLLATLLRREAPEIDARLPEATFLAWLDCSALGLADPARFFLDHARVALSDGPPFGTGSEQFVRLNFATSPAVLTRIVEAMGGAVREAR